MRLPRPAPAAVMSSGVVFAKAMAEPFAGGRFVIESSTRVEKIGGVAHVNAAFPVRVENLYAHRLYFTLG